MVKVKTSMYLGNESLEQCILRLRYSTTNPVKGQVGLFSSTVVAASLKISKKDVQSIIQKFFYRKYKAAPARVLLTDKEKDTVCDIKFLT